jgi:two-component system, cell cycle sensor histidine kinase and response regulator CckA
MAAPSTLFAHWSPQKNGVTFGIGAVAALALAVTGQGQIALALLAGLGAGGAILFAAGRLSFNSDEGRSEEQLRQIFRMLPAPVAVTNKKGVLQWGSDAFLNAAGGLGADQDLSRIGERQPETAAAVYRLFAAGRSGKPHAETIHLSSFPDGDPILLKVAPLAGQGRRTPLLIWQIEQVGRKDASGEKAREGLDALPVPALSVSKDLLVQGANKSFEKLAGFHPAGKEAWSLFRTRRGAPITRGRLKTMTAKGGISIPVQILGGSGRSRAALLHVGVDTREAQTWLVTPADLTAAGLDESFETLFSRAPGAMALATSKGAVLAANDAFRSLFGGPAEEDRTDELTGKQLASLVADTSSQSVKDKIASLAASGLADGGPVELQATLKGSLNKRVRLTLFPATNDANLIVQAVETGSATVIDEQAVQGQKLQAVGELAGGIAHDFNNLLTAIIGFSDLLLSRFRASDPNFKDLMNIKNNATRAAELVKQILAYSRRQTLRPAVLRITDVIEEFQATMGRTLGEKVKAKVQHGRDLWLVKADEGQFFQVVMNLAVNARDAMPDGGEITITTANVSERESIGLKDRGLERGEYVLCEVRDSGTGIKPEHLQKIFDPFFSTKEVGKGTGLGLSMVYGIVKQTGGAIVVDSEIGKGTSFRIYLPRYVETEQDRERKPSEPPAKLPPVDLTGSETVLLVEDEDTVRSFASRALATRGFKVLEASSGVEALEVMEREGGNVDLVVSDVVMPEMDGPTLLRHLRKRNPNIRIVFMSGYAEEAFRKNLTDENFVFLPKPFTLKKLVETVKAATA